MRIDSVTVSNFRSFAEYTVELHPHCNVLFGDNGAGKTAVLDILAIGLGSFLTGFGLRHQRRIQPADTRRVIYYVAGLPDMQQQFPTLLSFNGAFEEQPQAWLCSRRGSTKKGAVNASQGDKLLQTLAGTLREEVSAGQPRTLPVLAYYGTGRLWQHKEATGLPDQVDSRLDGYQDCLDPTSANLRHLRNWLRRRQLVVQSGGAAVPHIAGIEQAVLACVPGAEQFFYSFDEEDLCLRFADERRLPFSMLSDGYRNILLLVADLAWRAVALNPHLKERAPQESPGVVLIDEIDLSLHPRWQRRVVADLRRAFPKIQLVMTTHSPQVLGSAGSACRVLRLAPETLGPQRLEGVYGKDSNAILQDDMDVGRRELPVQEQLDRVGALIEAEKLTAASKLLDQLTELLGPHDQDVVRLQTLLHFWQAPLVDEEPVAKKPVAKRDRLEPSTVHNIVSYLALEQLQPTTKPTVKKLPARRPKAAAVKPKGKK